MFEFNVRSVGRSLGPKNSISSVKGGVEGLPDVSERGNLDVEEGWIRVDIHLRQLF